MSTAIEWTEATWNPVTGCDRVSPGCAHCYALTLAARLKHMGQARYQRDGGKTSGPGFGVTLHPDKLGEPLRWRRPRMIFVNSMSDLFHEEIPDEFIVQVFAAMAAAPQHTFQVLTKRPERMRPLLADTPFRARVLDVLLDIVRHSTERGQVEWPLPNVWLGVSIENRRFIHRADLLRATPSAVRFISAEPLLGPLVATQDCGYPTDYGSGYEHDVAWDDGRGASDDLPSLGLAGIDWLIVGGESGSGHRPMRLEWARDLRDICARSETAYFVKQLGGARPGTQLEDLPEDLRIREFPQ